MNKYYYSDDRVAVVAMSCLMPDAVNTHMLWNNLINRKVSVKELPDHIFDKNVFFRPDVSGKAYKNDKTYTKIGAVVDEPDFLGLGRKYRIPPAISAYFDNNQRAAIYCVDQAVEQLKSRLPKERTAVVLCAGAPGIKFENVVRRAFYSNIEEHILNHPMVKNGGLSHIDHVLKDVSDELLKDTQPVTEDTATGYLQNITAGRIANIFDLWGPSYIIDTACASSLTAIAESAAGLLNHEYDAVISGGVEVTLSEVSMIAFSGINALSPDGSYPFDARANGFVMGLGGGIVVLKRLSDAIRDGDQIYSVISGYGIGSDGKGKYIAAPSEDGQVRTIQAACKMAGYSVDTVEMLEAHGTGTIVGDVVEVSALKKAFKDLGAVRENSCGIGSVKSNIGHLRNAAGVAGLIKATLALHNKVLPASANIECINPKLGLQGSPFYVLTDNKEWKENQLYPRRANVSSFGFGGQNCHVCLEEFRPEFLPKTFGSCNVSKARNEEKGMVGVAEKEEVVLFSGESIGALVEAYDTFIADMAETYFEEAVYWNNISVLCDKEFRVAICAASAGQLKEKWKLALQYIAGDKQSEAHSLTLSGIYIGRGPGRDSSQIAFMFPGQGSQYPNMLKELYNTYPVIKAFYMKADAMWRKKYNASVLPLIFSEEEGQENVLKDTKNTHPAMFFSDMAVYKLLCDAGIKADYMIGHSLGEVISLHACGIIDLKSAVNIIGERGFAFDSINVKDRGSMLSVREGADIITGMILDNGFKVSIANVNSPQQTVVGGESAEINRFAGYLKEKGYKHTILNVSHAFHTESVTKAAEAFYQKIKDIRFSSVDRGVMACHLSDFYSNVVKDPKDMADVLKEQILSPVKFADSILKLYNAGVRVFIEAGPSDILTGLVKSILSDREVMAVNVNTRGKSSLYGFNRAISALFAYGVEVSPVPGSNLLGLGKEQQVMPVEKVAAAALDKKESTPTKESMVYSGVSMGLPGSFKKAFSDENFNCLTEGKNFIEMLTDEEAQSIMDLNISRLIKTEEEIIFQRISSLNEVIHFAGKFGKMDMINDYLIDEKLLNQMTRTACAGVAAGYEALKDAGIPLVREYTRTASGAMLPKRLLLPEEMRDDTGIIFGNGLYPVEAVISEVSKYTAAKFGSSTRRDIINFFEAAISKVSDYESRKILADWFALHYSRLTGDFSETDIYEFNHNFLALLTSQANNRLAQLIGATGPNMFLSAACSSTASAVTVSEDLIRAGHARRMIVIASDITSGKTLLPWFGAAFSSIGLLTDSDSLFDAAVPFDNRRKGTIISSGAVGLIIEKEADVEQRGMNGICRILGTHVFNTAGHQTRIDTAKHCEELNRFISRMEKEHKLDRRNIAPKMVYCSHETYSNKLGGCSNMEKIVLEDTFGEDFRKVKVINTKGMTGHTLGASIEEAVSAKALQYQKIPPVVNYREPDPNLAGLNLSKGGEYKFEYVLRTVSALGGHGNYHLLEKLADGDNRIIDKNLYKQWLTRISSSDAGLVSYGRILAVEDKYFNDVHVKDEIQTGNKESAYVMAGEVSDTKKADTCKILNDSDDIVPANINNKNDFRSITQEVLKIYSEITKYPEEMLELSMEVEADLGIDTVKQATIFGILADKFNFALPEGETLSNYPTIRHIVNLITEKVGKDDFLDASVDGCNIGELQTKSVNFEYVEKQILELISAITKYPVEMLEEDMELEADLGIDTIKQATIFTELSERYTVDANLKLSDFKTIRSIIRCVEESIRNTDNQIGSEKSSGDEAEPVLCHFTGKEAYINSENTTEDVPGYSTDTGFIMDLCIQYPAITDRELGAKNYDICGKNIIVIGDRNENVQRAAELFQSISPEVCKIAFESCSNQEEFEKLTDRLKDKFKVADVIFDCSHLGQALDFFKVTPEEEKEILYLNSTVRFMFYKKMAELRPEPALRILCAISEDGCFGVADDENTLTDPYYGALCGFYKGLAKEFEKSEVKIVDIGTPEQFEWSYESFARLRDELEEESQLSEIGYYRHKRIGLSLDNIDRSEIVPAESFDSDHFIVTGGGNGITAEIVRELSAKIKARFTIIGRTQLPPDIEELSGLDQASLELKRTAMYRSSKKIRKQAPSEIEKEYNSMIKAISAFKLMKEIRDNGNEVQYYSCDIRDYAGLKQVFQRSESSFGPASVIIHGAGAEKSRLMGQKTVSEFEEIFDVKAKGLCNLYRLADKEKVKVLIGFSSIAGRFGNRAQLDYCAANNFVSSFTAVVRSCNLRALSISWSGWKGTGMAWRNEFVKVNAEEMGIHLIEPVRGSHEFLNILLSSVNRNELVISRGLGIFTGLSKWLDIKNTVPLIDWISKKDGEIQKIHKVLSVKTDTVISHHRLGKVPLVPAVVFMEIGAQAHSLIYGQKQQYCFRDIKLDNPLKLFNEKPQEVVIIPEINTSGESIDVVFYNNFESKIGKGKLTRINSMKIYGAVGEYEDLRALKSAENIEMAERGLKEYLESAAARFGNSIRLGSLFMDEKASKINRFKCDRQSIVCTVALSEEQITNKKYNLQQLLINPAFADSLMQACGIHSSIDFDGIYLPWKVGEFGVIKVPKNAGRFRTFAKMLYEGNGEKAYDVILYGDNEEVYYYARNVIVKRIAQ